VIDALFGSKTRVKLLHLFLNNPGKAFYVREITRLIDEQINSVRRELANMLEVGVITSDSADNKLYYEVNQRYEYYVPFRAIFADDMKAVPSSQKTMTRGWQEDIRGIPGIRLAIAAGVLVSGSASEVDLIFVGDIASMKISTLVKTIEQEVGRELNYSVLSYDDFYYRLSVRDKFITQILGGRHTVIADVENVLKMQK
jgi:hypothetical protein